MTDLNDWLYVTRPGIPHRSGGISNAPDGHPFSLVLFPLPFLFLFLYPRASVVMRLVSNSDKPSASQVSHVYEPANRPFAFESNLESNGPSVRR